eukprot:m.95206 g.95206  ORF g.95206 m.95206 type:complete len:244 (+) comp13047_c0_seq1:181-912(+)
MDPGEWYKTIPSITRTLCTAVLVTTVAGNFGLVSPYSLILSFRQVWYDFEIWRPITSALFFGKLGFPFLINLFFLYSYARRCEEGVFQGAPGDFVWMLTILWVALLVVAFVFSFMLIGIPLTIGVLYVWSKVNADVTVSFWFGSKFPAMYLPWVLWAFSILMGGNGMSELTGIFVGHLYYFFKYDGPERGYPSFLDTPDFVKGWFPDETHRIAGIHGTPAQQPHREANYDDRLFRGQGVPLGQ